MSSTLILASTSPFRRAILEKLGVPFEVASPKTDETPLENETPQALVERLAIAKAKAIADQNDKGLIIGSDQVAVNNEIILGKPGDHATAVKQLQAASGKRITFYTGLALINAATRNIQSKVVPFHVNFRQLSDSQIENYLQKEQPYNCAGSFKSESLGICLFDKLEGDDPNTLIGLPLIQLVRMLENEGLNII